MTNIRRENKDAHDNNLPRERMKKPRVLTHVLQKFSHVFLGGFFMVLRPISFKLIETRILWIAVGFMSLRCPRRPVTLTMFNAAVDPYTSQRGSHGNGEPGRKQLNAWARGDTEGHCLISEPLMETRWEEPPAGEPRWHRAF